MKKQITAQIEESCKSCEFNSEKIELSLFPPRVIFDDVHFITGDAKSTLVDAQVERFILFISIHQLMSHLLKFKQVVIVNPVVTVTEGDLKGSRSKGDSSPSEWDLEMDHVELKNGQFTYKREHLGKTGVLQIGNINGEIGEFSSTDLRRDELVTAHTTAILEQSGKIDLTIAALLFSKAIHVDISLALNGLVLDETNRYFSPDDGIKLDGKILRAQSQSSIRGRGLHSKVSVDYEGLSLKFQKTSERSELGAVFSTLFSGVKSTKDRSRIANSERKPDEPLVGFILRGMKEAALKVATD